MEETTQIKKYARNNLVPIVQDEGLEFIKNYIKNNAVKRILEIGTAIGYSAIEFALVDEAVQVTTIEIDEARYKEALRNIAEHNLSARIKVLLGDAATMHFDEEFDLIFIDGPKAQYRVFFEHFAQNLAKGGAIISDNLSFHGMVEDMSLTHNYSTIKLVRKIRKYIDFLKNNDDFCTDFFPVGDTVSVSKRKTCHSRA